MFSTLDEDAVDALFAGQPPPDGNLAPIAELAAALRRSRAAEPVPAMSPALRAQLRPGSTVVPLATRKGRGALTRAGAVAAAAAVVVVGLGVGASQNRLPTALQDVVASTAELVGLHVPTTDERPALADDRGRSDTAPHGRAEEQDASTGADGSRGRDRNGGATPADPGTPGDQAPAVPATPPTNSNGTPGTSNGGTDPSAGREQSDSSTNPGGGEAPAPVIEPEPVPPDPSPQPPGAPADPAPEAPAPDETPETTTPPEPRGRSGSSRPMSAAQAGPSDGLPDAALEHGAGGPEGHDQPSGRPATNGPDREADTASPASADPAGQPTIS